VITLTEQATDIADPKFSLPASAVEVATGSGDADRVIEHHGTTLRVHLHESGDGQPAVLLPLDQLFEIRASAAVRLWRSITRRNPGRDPAALPKARRDRLILGLRALDGCVELFEHCHMTTCWRVVRISQRFQRSERRRTPSGKACCP